MSRAALLAMLSTILALAWPGGSGEALAGGDMRLVVGAGPRGSAMTHAANALALLLSRDDTGLDIATRITPGSTANLARLQDGELELGIAHAADILAEAGPAKAAPGTHKGRLRAIAALYPAPAQLIVHAHSGITHVRDLREKRVCIGGRGSSSALAAERLLRGLGLWEDLTRLYLGHDEALAALRQGRAEAAFILDGLPSMHVAELAGQEGLRLLDLHHAASASGFYAAHPVYTSATIPAGTYPGQDEPVHTFADTAWLCAVETLPARVEQTCLKALAAEDGREYLSSVVETAGLAAEAALGRLMPLAPLASTTGSELP